MNKEYDVKKLIDPDVLRQKIVEDPQIRGKAFAAVMRHLQEAPVEKVSGDCVACLIGKKKEES